MAIVPGRPAPCTTRTHCWGADGFVGVKTGADDAAGGAFRAIRWIDGKRTTITGVVLGQPGHDQITAVSRPPTPWSIASAVVHGAK
jgi:hypothetical protein